MVTAPDRGGPVRCAVEGGDQRAAGCSGVRSAYGTGDLRDVIEKAGHQAVIKPKRRAPGPGRVHHR